MATTTCCGSRKLTGTLPTKAVNEASQSLQEPWVIGQAGSSQDPVPLVSTRLSRTDRWGAWKARWTVGRMDYSVHPGLYGVGQPGRQSPILVTANYKLTLDRLRSELAGIDAWILVLDTKGINVWCAAGKGTFGTKEVIRRLRSVDMEQRVDHRTIILPQLGATGVKAHEVTQATGFRVVYGPVRAADLPAFLSGGLTATPAMRRVRFNTLDRLVLTPAEFVFMLKPAAILLGILFILNMIGLGQYGPVEGLAIAGTIVIGCILVPVLLPLVPGRAFAFKGALLGLLWAAGIVWFQGWFAGSAPVICKALAYLLAIPSVAGFLAMNFTGSTTFTSPSGVNKEMRIALPIMLIATAAGVLLLLAGDVLRLIL